jgi:ketosteroid isomerase-like protein
VSLEQRVRRLEDLDAITQLTYHYAMAVNKGPGNDVDLAAIARLFTTDARWSSDDSGTTIGAAGIVAELPTATAQIEFSAHAFLNPVITLDGDHATGAWLLWIASVHDRNPGAVYLSAELKYVRTADGWRIAAIHVGSGIRIPAV